MLQNARLVGCCADLVEVRSQTSNRATITRTIGEVRGVATGRRTRRILITNIGPRTDCVLFGSISFLQLHVDCDDDFFSTRYKQKRIDVFVSLSKNAKKLLIVHSDGEISRHEDSVRIL